MIKAVMHKIFNSLGLEIRLLKNLREAQKREKKMKELENYQFLANFDIKSIIDVGANEGQFARTIRHVFPGATIYSFEPLPDVYKELYSLCAEDTNIKTFNLALGNEVGTKQMFSSSFSPSSSMLNMSKLHKEEWPESSVNTSVMVQQTCLDQWVKENNQTIGDNILIKLDVQGYELSVIKGGEKTFKSAKLVIIEVSFYEFYEKQPLFDDIYKYLCNLGFVYRGNLEQFRSRSGNKILFADAIFENLGI
ncbi:FkbM family methyltransferase [Sphaerospermopsis sp. FACHB-1194]|uniref:FkbM family methyltransferase n=1 Tax=Sphaerospermopsis sp. FACHB-1194 TaxID=2692862 RepID=UPI001681BE06|nr:FkbM family methyltransferase [Sphaerospermopsis sp. FACHB-1194]